MKGVAFLVVGWIFMAPFAVYEGSKQVAKSPLGTDDDGKVRWVARALDPAAHEVNSGNSKYWYFVSAPTIEVRVFRDTKRSVKLTSFEIVGATNVDSADTGQRVGGEPIELKKTHAFEVWPADETKPVSFRFKATYKSGSRRARFGGNVVIGSVYPNGLEDPDSVEHVTVAEALQAAKRGASFSDAKGQDDSVAAAKARRRQRLASKRAARRRKLAQKRQRRRQQRQAERRQERALANQFDQTRKEITQDYRKRRREQREAKKRHEREMRELEERVEARKQAQREFKEQQRQKRLAKQRQAQQQPQKRKQQGYVPVKPSRNKKPAPTAKIKPQKITVGLSPMRTPDYEKTKGEPQPKRQEASRGKLAHPNKKPDCKKGEIPHLVGNECWTSNGTKFCQWRCVTDPDAEASDKVASSGKGTSTESGANKYALPRYGSDTSKGESTSSSSGTGAGPSSEQGPGDSGTASDDDSHCPGPADHRRQPQGTCLVVEEQKWGVCEWDKDKEKTFGVTLRNRCDMRVHFRICLVRRNDKPACDERYLEAYETDDNYGMKDGGEPAAYTCDPATGEYTVNAVFAPRVKGKWSDRCDDW